MYLRKNMTNINFNEPSNGIVTSNGRPALAIDQRGADAWGVKVVTRSSTRAA